MLRQDAACVVTAEQQKHTLIIAQTGVEVGVNSRYIHLSL